MAKKRIQRKALKQPDELSTLSGKIIRWCTDYKRAVMRASVALAVLLVVAGGTFLYRGHRESKARDLYDEAVALYLAVSPGEAGKSDLETAIAKLEEVLSRYESTGIAANALADLGSAYFQRGNYDDAIARYQDFLQRVDRHHSLYDQILESLGTAYEAKGDWTAAIEAYERLAREGDQGYQAEAQLCLGRVYESMGDRRKAMRYYENYLKDSPETFFSDWLRTKLARWRLTETPEKKS